MMSRMLIAAIRGYQLILRPLMAQHCRFHPSCSDYAIQALARYGFMHGSWKAVLRLSKCHPGHPGGFDPVDDTRRDGDG